MVHPGKKIITKLTDDLDYPFLGIMSFMTFLFMMVAIVILTSLPPPENEVMEVPDRFVELPRAARARAAQEGQQARGQPGRR